MRWSKRSRDGRGEEENRKWDTKIVIAWAEVEMDFYFCPDPPSFEFSAEHFHTFRIQCIAYGTLPWRAPMSTAPTSKPPKEGKLVQVSECELSWKSKGKIEIKNEDQRGFSFIFVNGLRCFFLLSSTNNVVQRLYTTFQYYVGSKKRQIYSNEHGVKRKQREKLKSFAQTQEKESNIWRQIWLWNVVEPTVYYSRFMIYLCLELKKISRFLLVAVQRAYTYTLQALVSCQT